MRETALKSKLYKIIFESDTPAGKGFDLLLIVSILASVIVVFFDSVQHYNIRYGEILYFLEWVFTILFTLEYLLRIYCISRPAKYIGSFFGIIDLLSILPTFISIFIPTSRYLSVIRILRVLRIFRILKLMLYIGEANLLVQAIAASKRKIIVFLFSVLVLACIFGSIMYLIEGEAHGFTSIPRSIYWAIVTITTVGYGDISPQTELGQALAAIIMILGYATIAIPTGIISSEFATIAQQNKTGVICRNCGESGHDNDAKFCKDCGAEIESIIEG